MRSRPLFLQVVQTTWTGTPERRPTAVPSRPRRARRPATTPVRRRATAVTTHLGLRPRPTHEATDLTTPAEPTRPKRGVPRPDPLQRHVRPLSLPSAPLPAALRLRLGQPDMLGANGVAGTFAWMQPGADVLNAAGSALFNNLPIIFALGVAVGYAKKADGTTGLAALIGYLVFSGVSDSLSPYVLGK